MAETQYTLDVDLELEDGAAAITADGAGSAILDLDSTAPRTRGDIVLDVSAMDITTGDETYTIMAQGSSSATFASTIQELACIRVGDGSAISSTIDVNDSTGRFVLPFINERNGTSYRYLRLYVDVAGTTPSITFKAWLAKTK